MKKTLIVWGGFIGLVGYVVAVAVVAGAPSRSCREYGGTPGERGWFSATTSCSWPDKDMYTVVEIDGRSAKLGSHAAGWCFRRSWRVSMNGRTFTCSSTS